MTITRATGFPVGGGSGTGQTTISVNPAAIGDLVIVQVLIGSNTTIVSGMSGGHATGWTPVIAFTSESDTLRMETWVGKATATGAQNVTITYSASVTGVFTELDADSLHSSLGSTWNIVAAGSQRDASGTTNNLPTLTATAAGQAYWGFASPQNVPTAGSSSGFTYTLLDSSFVEVALNAALSAAGSVTPSMAQTTAGTSTLVGMIVSETGVGTGLAYVGQQTEGHSHATTTVPVLKPYGVQTGDLLLIAGFGFLSTTTTSNPTGFTLVEDAPHNATLFARIADGSEGSYFTFTFAGGGDATAICIAIRGSAATSATAGWFDPSTFPAWFDPNTASTTIAVPAITLANSTDWLLGFFGAIMATSQVIGLPAGFASRVPSFGSGTVNAQDVVSAFGDVQSIVSGSTGIKTGTCVSAVRFGLIVGVKLGVAGVTGTGSVGLKKPSLSVTGTAKLIGTGSVSLKKPALSATGTETLLGTGSVSLKKPVLSATGIAKLVGTGSVGLKKPSLSATGTETLLGTGSVSLKKPSIAATGTNQIAGTGSVSLKKPALSATGTETTTGTGSVALKKPSILGLKVFPGTGSVDMHKMTLSSNNGSVTLHKMGVSASGVGKTSGTGSVALHKMSLAAVGIFPGRGSVDLHKMGISGSGMAELTGSGDITLPKMGLSGSGDVVGIGPGSGGVILPKMQINGMSTPISKTSPLFVFSPL